MDVFEFAAMIEETPVRTRVLEYEQNDKLIAACLTDVVDDGLSMVYSFFNPDYSERSLGTYLILDHISLAKELGLKYVYLGYWVPGSQKMGYKAKFKGLEIYFKKKWRRLETLSLDQLDKHPCSTPPVAEQVGELNFPGSVSIL